MLAADLAASCVRPRSACAALADWLSRLRAARHRHRLGPTVAASASAVLGVDDPAAHARIVADQRAQDHRFRALLARELLWPSDGPAIEFPDADRLRAALARGRGAIVWVSDTTCGPIIAKRALAQAGMRARHTSSPWHGLGQSAFAVAALNPLQIRAEMRWLAERMVFARDEGGDIVRRILKGLADGGLISMTNNAYAGAAFIELPFGRAGFVSMPTAALGIALRHGAPLFPLTAIEIEPLARYRIELGPELSARSAGRKGRDLPEMAALARAARDHLLDGLRAAPEQFPLLANLDLGRSMLPASRRMA